MTRSILISAMTALSLAASPIAAAVPHTAGDAASVEQSVSYDRKDSRHGSRHHGSYSRDRHHSGDYRHDDRRHYDRRYKRCRHDDGTAGLLIGGAAGAAIGNEVADDGDKTTGLLLGAAGGALIGKNLDDGVKCD